MPRVDTVYGYSNIYNIPSENSSTRDGLGYVILYSAARGRARTYASACGRFRFLDRFVKIKNEIIFISTNFPYRVDNDATNAVRSVQCVYIIIYINSYKYIYSDSGVCVYPTWLGGCVFFYLFFCCFYSYK